MRRRDSQTIPHKMCRVTHDPTDGKCPMPVWSHNLMKITSLRFCMNLFFENTPMDVAFKSG